MKTPVVAAALAAAFCLAGGAPAATVTLGKGQTQMIVLNGVSGATLSFAVDTSGGYVNSGGYVKWSTRADGRKDPDGDWGTCLECGYDGGSWALAYSPHGSRGTATTKDLLLDFGGTLETVNLWVRATHGQATLSWADTATTAPVPLPAGGILLATALGLAALLRRRVRA